MRNTVKFIFGGGLGNQLFQYAAYLWLLQYHGEIDIIPDFSQYRYCRFHNGIEINRIFNTDLENQINEINEYCLNHGERKQSEVSRIFNLISGKLKGYVSLYDSAIGTQPFFDQSLRSYKRILAAGFFQNDSFTRMVSHRLKSSIVNYENFGDKNDELLESIKGKTTISLHIRRGDYLSIDNYNIFNGLDYYFRAIEYIVNKFPTAEIIVFSNDILWAKENLTVNNPIHFVDWNKGNDAFKDMILMSKCSHNIIANSSFSWWGAWLNNNNDKIVVSPSIWFKDKSAKDVVPSNWVLIKP